MSTDKLFDADLLSFLLRANSRESMQEALKLLLTPTELQEMNNRILILKLLEEGVPQRKIAEKLGVAIATVSRGAKAFKEKHNNDRVSLNEKT